LTDKTYIDVACYVGDLFVYDVYWLLAVMASVLFMPALSSAEQLQRACFSVIFDASWCCFWKGYTLCI